jgi:hypothetical protein
VRQLYRRCCALRHALCATSTNVATADAAHSSTSQSGAEGRTEANQSPLEAFHNQLATLNMLISICGSYFGQGEEYDAFNYALSSAAGADGSDEDEDDDDGEERSWEEDEWENGEEDEENGEFEEDVDGAEGLNEVRAAVQPLSAGSWVTRPSAVASSAGRHSTVAQGAMDLEEGEELEEESAPTDTVAKRTKS